MSVKFKKLMNELPAEKRAHVKAMAEALNIKQPSIVALEKRGNDIKLSSVKRYVEAMGGALSLSVELPTGKTVTFNL